ncbi:glutathione peroxidase [Plebeiibacterium marinum]|uniref:Glutathione peroxidase n=1 Tax=Plebeiibacterium marinum TaxID=2992111 RepID=A0AAE3MEP0_9BACT|nr:glutathione peroxidase [Plebeiobacterium marinum]MCW3806071.1 glutathione peroxidase [Plebeiobacterium marinum]
MKTNDSNTTSKVKQETFKQRLLRKLYPTIRKIGKKGKNGVVIANPDKTSPKNSFYNLKLTLKTGTVIDFSDYKGKKVLLVNTASDCGYTGQYKELQTLHEKFGKTLQIIAFPSNDFANQEKGDDEKIAQFCTINYGVTFPVAPKGCVTPKTNQQPIFKWLSSKGLNGWNDHEPDWNFSKYLVDENGILTHYFGPSVSPLEDGFLKEIAL